MNFDYVVRYSSEMDVLADCMEAIIGAVWLDAGETKVQKTAALIKRLGLVYQTLPREQEPRPAPAVRSVENSVTSAASGLTHRLTGKAAVTAYSRLKKAANRRPGKRRMLSKR